jgi:hypothetical protein
MARESTEQSLTVRWKKRQASLETSQMARGESNLSGLRDVPNA